MPIPWTLARVYSRFTPTNRGAYALARWARRSLPRDQWQSLFVTPAGFKIRLDLSTYPDCNMALALYETESISLLTRLLKPGGHFVDCGANLGYFTLYAARQVGTAGRVDAIEPSPINRARLEENLSLNNLKNVQVHAMAAGVSDQPMNFYQPTGVLNHGQASTYASLVPGGQCLTVPSKRLDLMINHIPDLIKVDVEGAELTALRGAEAWLTSDRPPALIVEHNHESAAAAGYQTGELFTVLKKLQPKYQCFWIGWRLTPIRSADHLQNITRQGNLLFTPSSTRQSIPKTASFVPKIAPLPTSIPTIDRRNIASHRQGLLSFILAFALVATGIASRSLAGNIFEEDSTPSTPHPVKPAPPAVDSPRPQDVPGPAVEGKNPVGLPLDPVGVPPAARRPVPPSADQARSRTAFREVFAKQLADRSVPARRLLATSLIESAASKIDLPADHYVLLTGAIDAGQDASDLPLCVSVVDSLASLYEINALRYKTDIALKMVLRADSPTATARNCIAGLEIVNKLVANSDDRAATKLIASLRAATTDRSMVKLLQNRAEELELIRLAAEQIAGEETQLKSSPEDPALNLSVGKFLCFFKGDWKSGLPLLRRGSDPELAALAVLEDSSTAGALQQADLAERWWNLAQNSGGLVKTQMLRHAGAFYAAALPRLEESARPTVEQRLRAIAEINHGGANAIPGVDLLTGMRGTNATHLPDGITLLARSGSLVTANSIAVPVTIKITLLTAGKDVRLGYAAKQIIFNWEKTHDELRVDGGPADGRHKKGAGRLPLSQWTQIDLTVQRDQMIIEVDGKEIYRTQANFGEIDEPFSIIAKNGEAKIRSIEMVPGGK